MEKFYYSELFFNPKINIKPTPKEASKFRGMFMLMFDVKSFPSFIPQACYHEWEKLSMAFIPDVSEYLDTVLHIQNALWTQDQEVRKIFQKWLTTGVSNTDYTLIKHLAEKLLHAEKIFKQHHHIKYLGCTFYPKAGYMSVSQDKELLEICVKLSDKIMIQNNIIDRLKIWRARADAAWIAGLLHLPEDIIEKEIIWLYDVVKLCNSKASYIFREFFLLLEKELSKKEKYSIYSHKLIKISKNFQ